MILSTLYERAKLYRANPCDVDAHPILRPIQRGLAGLASACPCCSGARIVLVAATAAVSPAAAFTAITLLAIYKAVRRDTEDTHEEV